MLRALFIRNVVLIDKLDLDFSSGLSILTGETGAGKSILLDALSLSLGGRANSQLVRAGEEQAVVTAEFFLPPSHGVRSFFVEQGIALEETLLLKRILNKDGRSRAFINDQPVGASLLNAVGEQLVEVHGQFDHLLNAETHLKYLDDFGHLSENREQVKQAYGLYREARKVYEEAISLQKSSAREKESLLYVIDEFNRLAPVENEERKLLEEKHFVANRAKIMEALSVCLNFLDAEGGIEQKLFHLSKNLEKMKVLAPGLFSQGLETCQRVCADIQDLSQTLGQLASDEDSSVNRLQEIEERLYDLRTFARKHQHSLEDLPALMNVWQETLKRLENSDLHIEALQKALLSAEQSYKNSAEDLSAKRRQCAESLDILMQEELIPLKMDKAVFKTQLTLLNSDQWAETGMDRVEFLVKTNPGQPFGVISKIASGGERSRFMLALKVILTHGGGISTLIFDEIDSGVGGAVAAAIGERLARLGQNLQVFSITHSPQVASYASHHYRVSKVSSEYGASTTVELLRADERLEEIARMLAGDTVTEEARAAARSLLVGGGAPKGK